MRRITMLLMKMMPYKTQAMISRTYLQFLLLMLKRSTSQCPRPAPLLKIHSDGDNREWRGRSESTRELHAAICSNLPVTEERLNKMGSNVAKAMEKIKSREHTVNSQHEHLVAEYRNLRSALQDVQRRFTDAKEAETSRVNDMKRITDELDR